MYKKLVHLKSKNDTQRSSRRGCCLGIFGSKSERVDDYEKKLEDVEGNMRSERSSVVGKVNIIDCCHGYNYSPLLWFIYID